MTTLREAAKAVLDCWDSPEWGAAPPDLTGDLIEALRAVLKQPEQEPKCVAIIEVFGKDWQLEYMSLPVGQHKLYTQQYTYTAQAQRKPLTDEDIEQAQREVWRSLPSDFDYTTSSWIELGIRYAEAAHGIKETP